MAVLLGYVADVLFSITGEIVAGLGVEGIDDERLPAINLEAVAREHHDDEEVFIGGFFDSFLEV